MKSTNFIRYILVLSIVAITLIKISLIGAGFLSMQDERRYEKSGLAIQNLSKGDVRGFFYNIFSTKGRPGETIIKCIPQAVQLYTAQTFHLNIYEPRNSYPLFIFNYIIYCLILLVHYNFSKLFLKDELLSLLSVVIYSCLTNSYLYLRHALPYDTSLLILYFTFYKLIQLGLSDSLTNKKYFLLGLFSFVGYSVYPGYFPFVFLIGATSLFSQPTINKSAIHYIGGLLYLGGFTSMVVLFEMFSKIGNTSFIFALKSLSGTIIQGSFEECFTFLYKYLWSVEGLGGKIIIIGLTCYIINFIRHSQRVRTNKLAFISALLIMSYIVYASIGFFFHRFVFYGRLLHMYYPFICIVCVSLINLNKIQQNYKNTTVMCISILFVFSFYCNFTQYKTYSYPRDIGWKYVNIYGKNAVHNICEYNGGVSQIPSQIKKTNSISPSEKKYQSFYCVELVNCCYHNFYHSIDKNLQFYLKSDGILIESLYPYYTYKPYQYEGYGITERRNLDSIKPMIKAYGYKFEFPSK